MRGVRSKCGVGPANWTYASYRVNPMIWYVGHTCIYHEIGQSCVLARVNALNSA